MRARTFVVAAALVLAALTAPPAVASAPGGDVGLPTAPRPPADPGHGRVIVATSFTSTTGNVRCRRIHRADAWLECLLVDTGEILRFGPDPDSAATVPCMTPHADQLCRIGYGRVVISPASAADRARFADARRVPYERLVQLGRMTSPYPGCLVDPNLGTSCWTGEDDSVGEQIFVGVADSIWSCPGYEHVFAGDPRPVGADTCRVIRP